MNERENDRSCELFALKDGYQFVDHEEQKKYYYDKEGRVYSFFGGRSIGLDNYKGKESLSRVVVLQE